MITDLLHRLTTAPAGSWELDADVGTTLGWRLCWADWYSPETAKKARREKRNLAAYDPTPLPFCTTDLNATFAEAQRRGLRIVVDSGNDQERPRAAAWPNTGQPTYHGFTAAATPALAACAALIAAIGGPT
jgi:hypothetical protein